MPRKRANEQVLESTPETPKKQTSLNLAFMLRLCFDEKMNWRIVIHKWVVEERWPFLQQKPHEGL